MNLKIGVNKDVKDRILFGGVLLALMVLLVGNDAAAEYDYDKKVYEDCRSTAKAIIKDKGRLDTFVQWTAYSKWTHAEQCSQFLARKY